MEVYNISKEEQQQLDVLLDEIQANHANAECKDFLEHAYIYACRLPVDILHALNDFRICDQHSGVVVFRGYLANKTLPPTPVCWQPDHNYEAKFRSDFLGMLYSTVVGEAFGFETQQGGKLIHDVLPIKGKEHVEAGCSSLAKLSFHTEDAFHPHRSEFLCFMCLKNPTNVGISGASVDHLSLPKEVSDILRQDRFYTLPDNAHDADDIELQLHPILFGNAERPYICVDPDFTYHQQGDEEAKAALEFLAEEIEGHLDDIPLQPGDICFIDNFKWVHGHKPFVAKFDGNDRWMKRIKVSTCLKKSASYKSCLSSRLLSATPLTKA
jgi:Fe(II)/alpha-ketoglutarate-dependent arginine beta-hydroxylase